MGNKKTAFLTLAMRRSGQHAVINWICNQNQKNIVHLQKGLFFYLSKYKKVTPKKSNVFRYSTYINGKVKHHAVKYFDNSVLDNNDLSINFEDMKTIKIGIINNIDYLKDYNKRYIIVVRDPYNWIASCLKKKNKRMAKEIKRRISLWKVHMEYCLGIRTLPVDNLTYINFNDWVEKKNYRKQICDRLEIPFTDEGINEIPPYGEGSSFDHMNFDSKASKMKVNKRWREYRNDKHYLSLLDNKLKEYSEKYFNFRPI